MTHRICHVIFSTNRLEYLIPNLRSHKNLNFYGCEVDRVFIDDFPHGRNDNLIRALVNLYGFQEVYLHQDNLGLSATWREFWDTIKHRNYDYIFHQEDDIEFLEPVLITDLIDLLNSDNSLSQVQLSRQAWYFHEKNPDFSYDDYVFKNFRYSKNSVIFSPMASLYHHDIVKMDLPKLLGCNPNEGIIGKTLYENHGLVSANLKNYYGKHVINHIGEWFVGKRVLPNEPGYEAFSRFDPLKKYNSRDGSPY